MAHLLFAYDIIVFLRANVAKAINLKDCRAKYESWLGQLVNNHKSSIFYFMNTIRSASCAILDVLGLNQIPNDVKYLGIPLLLSRWKFVDSNFCWIEFNLKCRGGDRKHCDGLSYTIFILSAPLLSILIWICCLGGPGGMLQMERSIILHRWAGICYVILGN